MPLLSKQYVDVPMTNFSLAYNQYNTIADQLFPTITVNKRTGIFFEYGKDDMDIAGNDVRAPGASAAVIDYTLKQNTYGPLVDHSLKMKIPLENQENYMDPLDPFRDASIQLTKRAKLYKEVDAFNKLSDTSVVTQNSSLASSQWSDYANSSPLSDLTTAFDTLAASIMKPRNELTVVMGYPVFSQLINHPEIIERFKYSQAAVITADMLRNLFQVKEVIVGYAVKKTSVEGQTDTTDYIWGKNVWVMYIEPTPGLQTLSTGYTLNMPNVFGPYVMKRWYDTDKESDMMRISYYYQQFIMAAKAVYYFSSVVA